MLTTCIKNVLNGTLSDIALFLQLIILSKKLVMKSLYNHFTVTLTNIFRLCLFQISVYNNLMYVNFYLLFWCKFIDFFFRSAKSEDFKKNMLRLKRLVLIGGPDDQVITPWQSRCVYYCIFYYFWIYDYKRLIISILNFLFSSEQYRFYTVILYIE